ncbi:MAG TPA: enoyl-CoA hydratase-related protein [Candidatus Binataceae bacterium]|nr:enoyl-CoA hydratase-related protein [Candidatus Binataceae bacterium]
MATTTASAPFPHELKDLLYTERDGVGTITINRPEVHNAIGLPTMAELGRVLDWIESSSEVAAIVLTASGTRTFVAGGDLKAFEQLTTFEAAATMSRTMQRLMARLSGLPVPVIGAINGDSIGGGCEVALACDIRIVSETAHFGFKQVTIGITPAWGGRRRLVHLIGRARALTLLCTGELIDAAEALRIGLADRLVAPADLIPATLGLAGQIARNPRLAVRAIKRAVDEGEHLEGEQAIAFEADLFARTWMTEDHWEALAARKEGRAPNFRGR